MNLVLFGPPGSGKGTQAKYIEEELGIPQISTGYIFRQELGEQTELGREASRYLGSGDLVPDDVVVGMVKGRLALDDVKSGYILDGFPRTIPQALALDGFAHIDAVLNIAVDDDVLVERLTGRRSCGKCGYVYHLVFQPPAVEGKCDKCDGELTQREDDREATVRIRLNVYKELSLPVEGYYRRTSRLIDIDGTGDIQEVRARVMDALKDFNTPSDRPS